MTDRNRVSGVLRNRYAHYRGRPIVSESTRAPYQRLVKAWGIIFLVVFLVCLVPPKGELDVLDEAPDPLVTGVSLSGVLSGEKSFEGGAILPEGFEREVIPLTGFMEVRVSESKGVVGFYSDDRTDSVLRHCTTLLQERGWIEVKSGQAEFTSFLKNEGRYSWLYLSCFSISGGTSVVIQLG